MSSTDSTVAGMRVLVLANARYPICEPFAGGLEAWTWSLVTGLRRRGAEVTVFAGPGSDPALAAHELPVSPYVPSAAARGDVSMPAEVWMAEHHAYLQAMLHVMRSDAFDLVHNSSLHYLPIALSDALATPMVTTLHTPPTPWLESAISSHPVRLNLVAVSAFTARSWRHVADPLVIRNGIDLDIWPVGAGGSSLVWAGRIVPEKAPHAAAEIAQASGVPIRIAGPIGDAEYFRREVKPLLGATTEYVGHLRQHELADLIGGSAASLITPAWDEPYGLVTAESLACGTPVCAFGRGGVPEILDSSCARVVRANDVLAASERVPEVVGLRRAAVRQRAEQVCSIEHMLDQYSNLYLDAYSAAASNAA